MQVISCLGQEECKPEAVCWRVAMTSQPEDSQCEGPASSTVDKVS